MKRALPYSLKLIANNAGDNGSVVMQVGGRARGSRQRCARRLPASMPLTSPCKAVALFSVADAASEPPPRVPAWPQRVLDNPDPHFGYNAATGKYENLMEGGIIDPTKVGRRGGVEGGGRGAVGRSGKKGRTGGSGASKGNSKGTNYVEQAFPTPPFCPLLQVVRCALENATSVAKTFLTSDVVVTTIPEPEPAAAGAGMDMGGY